MRFISEYFWGILLIIVGILFIVKHVFNVDIPILRTVVGIIIIYAGLTLVFGGVTISSSDSIIFGNTTLKVTDLQKEYNIIFSNGTIDLTDLNFQGKNQRVKINTVFSRGIVIINKNQPVVVKGSAAFTNLVMPDNSTYFLGDSTYSSRASEDNSYLEIDANSVFGDMRIIQE